MDGPSEVRTGTGKDPESKGVTCHSSCHLNLKLQKRSDPEFLVVRPRTGPELPPTVTRKTGLRWVFVQSVGVLSESQDGRWSHRESPGPRLPGLVALSFRTQDVCLLPDSEKRPGGGQTHSVPRITHGHPSSPPPSTLFLPVPERKKGHTSR